MTPRDIDAAVAERVMGITLKRGPRMMPADHAEWYGPCDGFEDGKCFVCAGSPEQPRPYSSDISAAWQVVEKMRDNGYLLKLFDNNAPYATHERALKTAIFGRNCGGTTRTWEASEKTDALAICLAALEAVTAK